MENKDFEVEEVNEQNQPTAEQVFNEVVEVVRENFIASFEKESDRSLIMNFVGGHQFRLTIEKVSCER